MASCVCGVLVGAADQKDLVLEKKIIEKKRKLQNSERNLEKKVWLLVRWPFVHGIIRKHTFVFTKYKFQRIKRYFTIMSEAMEVNATHPRKQLLVSSHLSPPFRLASVSRSLADLLSCERAINSVAS